MGGIDQSSESAVRSVAGTVRSWSFNGMERARQRCARMDAR